MIGGRCSRPIRLYDGAITEDQALWSDRAALVSVPTLVLFSEGTSAYLGDSARRAADSIPNAVGRTLPGQFHDVDSNTLACELTTFLMRDLTAHRGRVGRM